MTPAQTPPPESPFGFLHDAFDSTAFHLAVNIALLLAAVFWLASAFWVWKDARRRVDDPWLRAVAVAVGLVPPFLGPLIYALFRPPEYLADVRERRLEIRVIESRLATRERRCPACRASVEAAFFVCPVCTTRLRTACAGCGAGLEPLWQVCPHCACPVAPRDEPTLAAETA